MTMLKLFYCFSLNPDGIVVRSQAIDDIVCGGGRGPDVVAAAVVVGVVDDALLSRFRYELVQVLVDTFQNVVVAAASVLCQRRDFVRFFVVATITAITATTATVTAAVTVTLTTADITVALTLTLDRHHDIGRRRRFTTITVTAIAAAAATAAERLGRQRGRGLRLEWLGSGGQRPLRHEANAAVAGSWRCLRQHGRAMLARGLVSLGGGSGRVVGVSALEALATQVAKHRIHIRLDVIAIGVGTAQTRRASTHAAEHGEW
jgi:hypothetical protein